MAHPRLNAPGRRNARDGGAPRLVAETTLVCLLWLFGCGGAPRPVEAPVQGDLPDLVIDAQGWGRFHSARHRVWISLPQGRSWRIDDRSRPELVAESPGTRARLELLTWRNQDGASRQRCEEKARADGFVPERAFAAVEDDIVHVPEGYDTRVWVVAEPGLHAGSPLRGHVFAFAGRSRECLVFHYATEVLPEEEQLLSERLALVRQRTLGQLRGDTPRVGYDAEVPKTSPR